MKTLGKKKIIILIIIIVFIVLVATGTAVFFLFIKDKNKAPEIYFGKDEEISSITKIVGERDLAKPKSDKKKKKKETYTYTKIKNPADDVEKYVKYLEDKKKFQDIEFPKEVAEGEEVPPETEPAVKTHYELGADSKQAGTLLKITIDYKKDSYKVVLEDSAEKLEEVVAEIEDKKAEILAKDNPYTRMDAESNIKSRSAAELGLPAEPSNYLVVSMSERVQFQKKDYYDVRVYQKVEGGGNLIVGRYMVDCSSVSTVLKYDIANDSYIAISKTS